MNHWLNTWKKLITLAWPIFAAQLSMTAMNFVDTVMAGNYNAVDLAAIAIGGSIWLPTSLAAQAVLFSVTAISSQHWGAKQYQASGDTLKQGLWLAVWVSITMAITVYFLSLNLHWFKVEDSLLSITQDYLFYLVFAFPGATLYQALRAFIESTGRTSPIMVVNFMGLLVNIPLNYMFIYGKLGLPVMGGAGCGLATLLVFYLMPLGLLLYILSTDLRSIAFNNHWVKPIATEQKKLFNLGFPIAITMFIEVSIFAAIALVIAPLGVSEVAGHQIALSFTAQVFMLPVSLSLALTISIGHLLGANNISEARFTAKAGLGLSLIFATFTCLFMLLYRADIAALYTKDPALISIAVSLLFYAAVYQFPDALQVCAIGSLRGYKVTKQPLYVVLIAYWLIALPVGYSLGLTDIWGAQLGAKGLWIGLVAGLSFAAIFLMGILYKVSLANTPDS